MAQTYTRQSSIADGDTITAALFNNEYNQLLNAFSYSSSSASSTGHRHDGTAGQGGNIHTIGDLDFLNKIVVDSTNNRWGVFVEVSSAAVEQIRIQDGAIVPVTDNDIDLGTSSLEFKDAYFDGTVTTDALVADTADINGGTVDGATVGANSASSGAFTTITASSSITGSGTVQGTTITATTAFVPDASDGAALGTSSLEFSDLFLADGAVINFGDDQDVSLTHVADTGLLLNSTMALQFNDASQYINAPSATVLDINATDEIELNATLVDINANVEVSGTLTVAGAVDFGDAALSNVGAVQLDSIAGDGDTDTSITFSGSDVITIAAGGDNQVTFTNGAIVPSTDNDIDLGTSSTEFKDAYFDGTVTTDALVADTADINGGTVDGAIIGGASAAAITGTAITGTSFVIGSADINEAELETIDGVTAGTVTASKAVVVDSNKDIGSFRNITLTGELDAATLDISGNADIDGTLEADAITVNGTALASVIAGTTVANATLAATTTVTDSTANTNFPVVFHDESNALLDDTGALRYNPSTGQLLVPNLTVAGTTTTVDTVTMEASNAIIFEGATADAHETTLTVVDPTGDRTIGLPNVSGTLPVLAAASTTQITSTPEELNILDGATVVVGEINALDLGSTAVGTAIASKAVILDSNKDYTGVRNLTISGELDAATLDISGAIDVAGTANLDVVDVDGAVNFAADVTFADGADIITASAGTSNFRAGVNAGNSITSGGNYNVCVGDEAGTAITTGDSNTLIGYLAGDAVTTVSYITAVGEKALSANTSGQKNTAVGRAALQSITTVNNNTAVGYNCLSGGSNAASGNTGVGADVLSANTSGANNTGVGLDSLKANTTGSENTAVGANAGDAITTGGQNVAVGNNALGLLTTGSNNTAIGREAGKTISTSSNNTLVGRTAGMLISTGEKNVVVGSAAGDAITTGSANTTVGFESLTALTTGANNVAIGEQALADSTTSDNNTAVGRKALKANTTGTENSAVGSGALRTNSTGDYNTAFGYECLRLSTTSDNNTAMGHYALGANTTGYANTAIGSIALDAATTANNNTAVGRAALTSATTGGNNVAVGLSALEAVTTGGSAVGVGANAGHNLTTGGNSIFIGELAHASGATVSNEICIGYNTGGKGANSGFINPNGGGVYQGNNSSSWATTSDERIKKNITDCSTGLNKINELKVRNFEYRELNEITDFDNPEVVCVRAKGKQVGVIAQEAQEILPEIVKEETTGCLKVDASNLTWYLVNAVQELSAQVEELKAQINEE